MNFDLTFPHYAKRMNQYILVIAVIGAGILLAWQGWAYAIAWGLGCLFHIFFFEAILFLFRKWERLGKSVEYIGRRLVVCTMLRFVLEILLCVAVIFSPIEIFGFLGGLLTLPVATVVERLVGLIKE